MKLKHRDGIVRVENDGQDRILSKLYGSCLGRAMLKPLTAPTISKLAGSFLSTKASKFLIDPFIKSNRIDMRQYEAVEYDSYNTFFSRKVKKEARPIDPDPKHLISPADSKLTVLPITEDLRFTLKHTEYSVASLLKNSKLAARYAGGYAMIFRLSVDDYHRYHYVADGFQSCHFRIPGALHTVNPIANDYFPIYKENTREYSILHTKEFGNILMMEVGALMVGKIVNHHNKCHVKRGQEKGYFQFGGSTVVLLFKKDTVIPDADLLENTAQGYETVVKMGEKVGIAKQ